MLRTSCWLLFAFTRRNYDNPVIQATSQGLMFVQQTPPRTKSAREARVEELSWEVFSKGNVHIKNVEEMSALPEGKLSYPEVCFIGKPNCGKSLLIGGLCHNKFIGKKNVKKGGTKKLAFFCVGDALLLVDTPGYGAWTTGKDMRVKQALAFANTRRYMSLRKHANLKRVYWVIEATAPYRKHKDRKKGIERDYSKLIFEPRDEEILEFLRHEQIPFTVVLSKIDRCRGDLHLIRSYMESICEFLGTDRVPILEVAVKADAPQDCVNLDALQHDITFHCCKDLKDTEICYDGLRSLSYLPPTASDYIAAEEKYPFEAFLVPPDDSIPMTQLVEQHNSQKALLAQRALANNQVSEKCLSEALGLGSLAAGVGVEAALRVPVLDAPRSPVASQQPPLRRDFSPRGRIAVASEGDIIDDPFLMIAENSCSVYDRKPSAVVIAGNDVTSAGSGATVVAPTPSLGGAALINRSSESHVSSVVGIPIPRSMVSRKVNEAAMKLDKAAEAYAAMIERQGVDGVVKSREAFFMTKGRESIAEISQDRKSKRFVKYYSRLERNSEMVLQRFVGKQRADRSISLDAQGYMYPWLEGSGGKVPATSHVIGAGVSGISRGGSVVRGLKSKGFGGNSCSAKTFKNRGRATKKVGSWAS